LKNWCCSFIKMNKLQLYLNCCRRSSHPLFTAFMKPRVAQCIKYLTEKRGFGEQQKRERKCLGRARWKVKIKSKWCAAGRVLGAHDRYRRPQKNDKWTKARARNGISRTWRSRLTQTRAQPRSNPPSAISLSPVFLFYLLAHQTPNNSTQSC